MSIRIPTVKIAKILIHLVGMILIRPFLILNRPDSPPAANNPIKILLVSLAYRGDFILCFPAIRELKRRFPRSYIVCWTREYNRSVAQINPDIDEVVVFEKFRTRGMALFLNIISILANEPFVKEIRKKKFDLYIDDAGYIYSAFVGILARIPFRIGRNTQGFGFLNHYEYPYDFNGHLVGKKLKLLQPLGIELSGIVSLIPQIMISDKMIGLVSDKTGVDLQKSKYFTVMPFAGWSTKNWDNDKFAFIINEFASYTNAFAIFIGGDTDKIPISEITKSVNGRFMVFAGHLDLSESAVLISKAAIHIGVDSVGSHLAAAAGTKSLAIFGPTNPRLIACLTPINIAVYKKTSCTPPAGKIYCCRDAGRSCPHISCMRELDKEDVLAVLKDLWDGKVKSEVIEF